MTSNSFPYPEEKMAVVAASAAFSIFAAVRSRAARLRAAAQLERSLFVVGARGAGNSPASHIVDVDEPSGGGTVMTLEGLTSMTGGKRKRWLALHAILSVVLVYVLTRPTVYVQRWVPWLHHEVWCHVVGIVTMVTLGVHVIIYLCTPEKSGKVDGTVVSHRDQMPHKRMEHIQRTISEDIKNHSFEQICNGRWNKSHELSDSMDALCDLMGIYGVLRVAVNLIRGTDIHIHVRDGIPMFEFAARSGILWFKVRESYPLDGQERRHRRRDLRPGGSSGKAKWCCDPRFTRPQNPVVILRNEFGGKWAGIMVEEFSWPSSTIMHVDTTVTSENGSVTFRQVFFKHGSNS